MREVVDVVSHTSQIIDKTNIIGSIIIGFFTVVFGEYWFLFAGFMGLNVIDWLSGNYKARVLRSESSVVGYKGIIKKVWYWVVIAIAFFISHTFVTMGNVIGIDISFVHLFGWLTLAMYIVNEIRSVLENLVEIGVEIPDFLIQSLDITQKLMDAKTKQQNERMKE